MSTRGWLALAAGGAAAAVTQAFLPVVQAPAPAPPPGAAFRIVFGLKDPAARSWDGRLQVPGGRLISLTGWHFGPEDRVDPAGQWKCATRPRAFNPAVIEPPAPTPILVGLISVVEGPRVEVTTANGSFGFAVSDLPAHGARLFLDGQAAVERVPAVERHDQAGAEDDYPVLAPEPSGGALWMAWQSYQGENDSVLARRFDGKSWGQVSTLLEKGDVYRTAVATAGSGETWVVWSQQVAGNWDLYGRPHRDGKWGVATRLTEAPQPDIMHRLVRDSTGALWLVWQGARDGQFDILARRHSGGVWGPEQNISHTPENDWDPAIATGSKGEVWVAWDGYESGNYDIYYSRQETAGWSKPALLAASSNFEAHVSLAVDAGGRLWAAWDEGGRNWGKDTGFTIRGGGEPGSGLYAERRVRVACLEAGRWLEPATAPEYPVQDPVYDFRDRPQLAADDSGRIWLAWRARYRFRLGQGMGGAAGAGAWETYLAGWDGARWTAAQFVPQSAGRADTRVALAADGGGLWVVQAADQRSFTPNRPENYDLIIARLSPGAGSQAGSPTSSVAVLRPLQIHAVEPPLAQSGERTDIDAIRRYRVDARPPLRILRGDMHRHTDISIGDGIGDGSLADAYRYALDAAGFDYLAVTDHNYGDNEYSWWRTQKSADLFRLEGRFVPLYAYERSVNYPNGHRNVVHARRGIRWFPIPDQERRGEAGAARLYEYLKKTAGVAMSHTSATNMGTDWRDHDPEVEPVVEIYQGDRTNYEYEGAPRAASGGRTDFQPGGFRPAGFVRNAWGRGYRLGMQASSDHLSTHISYAMLLVPEFTRQAMLEAIRKRHTYGATDNIILDLRLETPAGETAIQGDLQVSGPQPRLRARIRGTSTVERVDIIKNNNVVYSATPGCQTCSIEFTDQEPDSAVSAVNFESFYYLRVRQHDGQLAWSSPIWVRRK